MSEETKLENRGLLLNSVVEALGSPGIMVNPDIAARTGCRCYKIDETLMCFSKGIIGTLSKAQVAAYCPTKEILTEGGLVERVKAFKEAAAEVKEKIKRIPKGEKLKPMLREMSIALAKRGIEV